jgi:hypothetical protein
VIAFTTITAMMKFWVNGLSRSVFKRARKVMLAL